VAPTPGGGTTPPTRQAIPQDVAQSMAFEQEPVELRRLQEILDQMRTVSSKPLAASYAYSNSTLLAERVLRVEPPFTSRN